MTTENLRPHIRWPRDDAAVGALDLHTFSGTWTFPQICADYNWPTGLLGGGVIGILEFGGGYYPADVAYACAINGVPIPFLTDISIGPAGNNPGTSGQVDAEVALDIQGCAAAYSLATGSEATIRVYFVDPFFDGLFSMATAITQAAEDGCDVLSISWGLPEHTWQTYYGSSNLESIETAAAAATAGGMVIFAGSGDTDSGSGLPGENVDVPASCPHVIGCGGTTKGPTTEVVWGLEDLPTASGGYEVVGTGGGYSKFFPPQSWQLGIPPGPDPWVTTGETSDTPMGSGSGRMVPDVAANADPETGYEIVLYGKPLVIGGTSACAPLYAGLFASFGQKLGFVTPTLYEHPECFVDIIDGSNGAYSAGVGPDPCTGMGAPDGRKLAALFNAPSGIGPPGVPILQGAVTFAFGPILPETPVYFTVPEWCTYLQFDVVANGGFSGDSYLPQYGPGRVTGVLPVNPNETLTLQAIAGGRGGGRSEAADDNGGDAMGIYRGDELLILAGGGGGTGEGFGVGGFNETAFGRSGGGLLADGQPPVWGGGGTQTTGGAAADGTGLGVFGTYYNGTPGVHLGGGHGGIPPLPLPPEDGVEFLYGGGGGGAGWYGGGGGLGSSSFISPVLGGPIGTGGGGGSSYTAPDAGISNLQHYRGYLPDFPLPGSGIESGPYVIFQAYNFIVMPIVFAKWRVPQPGPPGPPLRLSGQSRPLAGTRTRWLPASHIPGPTPG